MIKTPDLNTWSESTMMIKCRNDDKPTVQVAEAGCTLHGSAVEQSV